MFVVECAANVKGTLLEPLIYSGFFFYISAAKFV